LRKVYFSLLQSRKIPAKLKMRIVKTEIVRATGIN